MKEFDISDHVQGGDVDFLAALNEALGGNVPSELVAAMADTLGRLVPTTLSSAGHGWPVATTGPMIRADKLMFIYATDNYRVQGKPAGLIIVGPRPHTEELPAGLIQLAMSMGLDHPSPFCEDLAKEMASGVEVTPQVLDAVPFMVAHWLVTHCPDAAERINSAAEKGFAYFVCMFQHDAKICSAIVPAGHYQPAEMVESCKGGGA